MATPPEHRDPAERPRRWNPWPEQAEPDDGRAGEGAQQPYEPSPFPDQPGAPYQRPEYQRPEYQPPQPLYPSDQYAQPTYPAQQFPGQQYPPQPFPPQHYQQPGQGYPPQQYPPQDHAGPSAYPDQQYPDQQYLGQQYPGQYSGQQVAGQQYPGQQYPGQQYPPQYYPQPEYQAGGPGGGRGPRWGLIGTAVVALLAVVIGGAFWLHGRRSSSDVTVGDSAASGQTAASAPAPSTSAPEATPSQTPSDPPTEVSDVQEVSAGDAKAGLADAGVTLFGEVRSAQQWTDANGGNLLVASRRVDAKDGDRVTAVTIRVVHVTHTDGDPTVVRRMTDPSGDPCDLDFDSDIDPDFSIVKDLDGDGVAEATVSWHLSCRGDVSPALAKVTVLSDGRKYILRGDGWPGGPPGDVGQVPPAKVTEAEPPAAQWPDGFKDAATEVFLRLYG